MSSNSLMFCPDCGKQFSRLASKRPNCGRPNKKKKGCIGCFLVILIIVIIAIAVSKTEQRNSHETKTETVSKKEEVKKNQPGNPILISHLSYLKKIKEITRIEITGYDVYLSFKNNQLPEDYKLICNAAAVNGSEALVKQDESITRCSVWIIPENAEMGDVDHVFYEVTARKGRIE